MLKNIIAMSHTRLSRKYGLYVVVLAITLLTIQFLAPLMVRAATTELSYSETLQIGSTGTDLVSGVAFTSDSKKITTGNFSGTVNFDLVGGTHNATSQGSTDVFLAQYNTDNSLDSLVAIGGATAENMTAAPEVDSSDNIYITGTFTGTVDFDPTGSTDNHTSNGGNDVFISKYSSNGTYQWTKTYGGSGGDSAENIKVDQNGLYLAGRYASTVDFDPGAGTANQTVTNTSDPYTLKLTHAGIFVWVNTIASNHNDDGAQGLDTDSLGNVYVTGYLRGSSSADFYPGPSTDTRAFTGYTGFLSIYDKDGTYINTILVDGPGTDSSNGVAIDSDDNIYLSGLFQQTVDFNPGASTHNVTSAGANDAYLTRFNSSRTWQWTRTIGGSGNETNHGGISIDNNDNAAFFIAFASPTIQLDNEGSGDVRTRGGSVDGVVTIHTADGTLAHAHHFEGSTTSVLTPSRFGGLIFNGQDDLYASGSFSGTVDFDDAGIDNHSSAGDTDGFITELSYITYHYIENLPAGLTATTVSGDSVDDEGADEGVQEGQTETIRLSTDGGVPLADIATGFNADLDWSNVTAGSDAAAFKAFVHNLTSAPGTAATYSLYVPYRTGDDRVVICPAATNLVGITATCNDRLVYSEADAEASIVMINSARYWKITGLTGTGGLSTTAAALTTEDPERLAETGQNYLLLATLAIGLTTLAALLVCINYKHKLVAHTS